MVAVWGILSSGPVLASTVTVPDEYLSVQKAIDSGADTVLVRDGTYPEIPQAYRGVTLRGIGERRPRLQGLAISNPFGELSRRWTVSGIDFAGRVTLSTPNVHGRNSHINFTECVLDSGLQHVLSGDIYDIAVLGFAHCRLPRACDATAADVIMQSDTIDVGVSWYVNGVLRVWDCWFRGGPGRALDIRGDVIGGVIEHNLFEDYTTAIYATYLDEFTVASNVIRRMADAGLDVGRYAITLAANFIADCGIGIRCDASPVELYDNTVLRSRTSGLWFRQPDVLLAERNIVGHCGGSAIFIWTSRNADLIFLRNTLFNNGMGFDFDQEAYDNRIVVQNNISVGNSGWGLGMGGPQGSVTLGCNDWFANGLGSVVGAPESPEDFNVDPQFCNAADDDVTLFADSPLVTQPACGQIGARGVGCSVTATTLTRLSVTPEHDGLVVHWGFGASDPAGSWVERAVQETGPWDSLGSGSRVTGNEYVLLDADVSPDQVYLYRVAWPERGTIVYSAPVSGKLSVAGPLSAVMPNPSYGGVDIEWAIANPSETEIRVYDLAGREVATVVKGRFGAGRHRVRWDGQTASGEAAPAGWYIVRVGRGDSNASHRVLLLR